MSKGHNQGVDWWALGVVLFECYFAESPFDDNCSDLELFKRIAHSKVRFPTFRRFGKGFETFILGLLTKDPARRLGCMRGRANDVLENPWMSSLGITDVKSQKLKAPYTPPDFDAIKDDEASKLVDVPPSQMRIHVYNSSQDRHAGWDSVF